MSMMQLFPQSMPGWTLSDTHPTQGRTFQRPLGPNEVVLFWVGLFDGAADSMPHYECRLVDSSRDAHLFSEANIARAWLSTKRRYPLVGATVRGFNGPVHLETATNSRAEGGDGDSDTEFTPQPYFTVRERELSVLHPHEIVLREVTGSQEVRQFVDAILNGPRHLPGDLLVQLYVLRETGSERTNVLHFMTLISHCIVDRLAHDTLIRCFLDTLARGGGSNSEPTQIPLEDRLAMAVPFAELEPTHIRSLSPAIRRWRRAAAALIAQLRKGKMRGGHALPCRVTGSTPNNAPRSGYVSTSFTHAETTVILANCRLHNVSFGGAHIVLAQVAMTRILYRHYLRGSISEEEWAYRMKQPHLILSSTSLRPYLDKSWFDRGGGGEFMMAAHTFHFRLPSMALGTTVERLQRREDDKERTSDAPPFSELLSFDRFLHRTSLVKKQLSASFSHPLLLEILLARSVARVTQTRLAALKWMGRVESSDGNRIHSHTDKEDVLSVMDVPKVEAFNWSSYGNLDSTLPHEYPISSTHPLSPNYLVPNPFRAGYATPPSPPTLPFTSEVDASPKITMESIGTCLRVSPSDLFICSYTFRGQLSMVITYDRNVFEDQVVREWLDEVRGAVLWYLGRLHPWSHYARQSRTHDNKQADVDKGIWAKL